MLKKNDDGIQAGDHPCFPLRRITGELPHDSQNVTKIVIRGHGVIPRDVGRLRIVVPLSEPVWLKVFQYAITHLFHVSRRETQ